MYIPFRIDRTCRTKRLMMIWSWFVLIMMMMASETRPVLHLNTIGIFPMTFTWDVSAYIYYQQSYRYHRFLQKCYHHEDFWKFCSTSQHTNYQCKWYYKCKQCQNWKILDGFDNDQTYLLESSLLMLLLLFHKQCHNCVIVWCRSFCFVFLISGYCYVYSTITSVLVLIVPVDCIIVQVQVYQPVQYYL